MTASAKAANAGSRGRRNAVAAAAHELRTPLDVVIGMTRLLLDTDLDAEQLDHAATILSSAEAAAAVVDDLVDGASIRAGEFALAEAPFAPGQLLDECVRIVAPQAAEKRLSVDCNVARSVPPALVGDGPRLRRVLHQMLARIVRASSDGRLSVGMTAHARRAGGVELRVSVRSSARGALDRKGVMGGGAGAAAGPSVSASVVRSMGGRVRVTGGRSGVPQVEVRVVVGRASASESAGRDVPSGPRGRALRVLVVDDDPLGRKATVRALSRSRWRVDSAADAESALDAVVGSRYDLVLLDLHLGGTDGRDVAREIRRRVPSGGPRIVAMTAAPDVGGRAAWITSGFDAGVAKPVDPERIRRALRDLPAGAERAAPSPTEIDAVVLHRFRSRRGGGAEPSILAGLIDDYLAEIPRQLESLREHAARTDAAALRDTAHHVAGTSASIGAAGIAALSLTVERLAADGDVLGAADVVERLNAAWPEVKAVLGRERDR